MSEGSVRSRCRDECWYKMAERKRLRRQVASSLRVDASASIQHRGREWRCSKRRGGKIFGQISDCGENRSLLASRPCRICQREVFSKLCEQLRRLVTGSSHQALRPAVPIEVGRRRPTAKANEVNFALTIGMLKLRRRLRSTRPFRRPALTWETLHIPVAPCLCGWRDHIRR